MQVFGTTLDGKDVLVYRPTTDGGGFAPLPADADFDIVITGLTQYKTGDCFPGLVSFDYGATGYCGSGIGTLIHDSVPVSYLDGWAFVPLDVYNEAVVYNIFWLSHVAIWSGMVSVVAAYCAWCLAPLVARWRNR